MCVLDTDIVAPLTSANTPCPGIDLKLRATGSWIFRFFASFTIAYAMGCSDGVSDAAATSKILFSVTPEF